MKLLMKKVLIYTVSVLLVACMESDSIPFYEDRLIEERKSDHSDEAYTRRLSLFAQKSEQGAHIPISIAQSANRDGNKERVVAKRDINIAYVFAGSARSFVCPKVHWSIRLNLIDGFGGMPHVFVRLSNEDNENTKTGKGRLKKVKYKDGEIDEALKVLNPKEVEYFSFENQISEMERNYPGERHKVFRENDLRRYSMFFNRCMAYKMAMRFEETNKMRFDWIVLVRVDAAWTEPVLPIDMYANDRVWLTETGFALFNDQFMLVPRQFGDYIYDLNTKVQKGVSCLGGPDVETSKCDEKKLRAKKNMSNETVMKTLDCCCPDLLEKLSRKDGKGQNLKGYSEAIHLRHLQYGKIPVAIGHFPVLLTRLRGGAEKFVCDPECGRLYYNAKEYQFLQGGDRASPYPYMSVAQWPDTRYKALSMRDSAVCDLVHNDLFPWKPPTALVLHKQWAAQPHLQPINYSQPIQSQYTTESAPYLEKLLPDQKDKEIWRIHPSWNMEGCLSVEFPVDKFQLTDVSPLAWNNCKMHSKKKGGLRLHLTQAFFLHVYPHQERNSVKLTGGKPRAFDNYHYTRVMRSPPQDVSANRMRVMIAVRIDQTWNFNSFRCLTAENNMALGDIVTAEKCLPLSTSTSAATNQEFIPVQGTMAGSHPLSTVGKLRLASDPSLCVGRPAALKVKDMTAQSAQSYWQPPDGKLQLMNCDREGRMSQVTFEFEFITSF